MNAGVAPCYIHGTIIALQVHQQCYGPHNCNAAAAGKSDFCRECMSQIHTEDPKCISKVLASIPHAAQHTYTCIPHATQHTYTCIPHATQHTYTCILLMQHSTHIHAFFSCNTAPIRYILLSSFLLSHACLDVQGEVGEVAKPMRRSGGNANSAWQVHDARYTTPGTS